jgi:hypothetical protein
VARSKKRKPTHAGKAKSAEVENDLNTTSPDVTEVEATDTPDTAAPDAAADEQAVTETPESPEPAAKETDQDAATAETEESAADAADAADAAENDSSSQERNAFDELVEEEASAGLVIEDVTEATTKPDLEPSTPPAPMPSGGSEPARKGGFVPSLLGGVIAAGLGFGAAQFVDLGSAATDPLITQQQETLTSQAQTLDALRGQADQQAQTLASLESLPSTLAALTDQVAGLQAALDGAGDQLAGLETRLNELEKQPLAQSVSPEAIAAYERELEELRNAITAQKADVAAQQQDMKDILAAAQATEASAEAKAELAASRAALSELTTKLQAGQPYDGALAVLMGNGVDVPQAVAAAATDGVPGLTTLVADFPPVARAALKEARNLPAPEGEEAPKKGFGAFLQDSLGARSVTPREGDDADAVLSRVEAAVKSADLETALSEINALPDPVKAVMQGWIANAELRRDALAGASALAQELNSK